MSVLLIYLGAQTISTARFFWFRKSFNHESEPLALKARIWIVIAGSAILSPGALFGHGAVPFPAGLAVFWSLYEKKLGAENALMNGVSWSITIVVFAVVDILIHWRKKKAL